MTARDAGGIATRIFALYILMHAFDMLFIGLSMFQVDRVTGDKVGEQLFNTPTTFVWAQAVIYAFAALLLWVKSRDLWPAETEMQASMDYKRWLRLGLLLLGAYFLLEAGPFAIAAFFSPTLQSGGYAPRVSEYRNAAYGIQAVVGLILVIYGFNTKTAQPTFDEQ